jgi:hypothetical protein
MMEENTRCQSCGMRLSPDSANSGTDEAGAPVSEYCIFCYENGGFVNPDQTVEEMIESSIDNMTTDLRFPLDYATKVANDLIPTLKRWN